MKKYKYGFTLSEILLALVIVGVILAFAVTTLKALKASYTPLAYFANNNVNSMVRVLFSEDMVKKNITYCETSDENIATILMPDGYNASDKLSKCSELHSTMGDGGYSAVCESLVSIVNRSGSYNCSNLSSVKYDSDYFNEPYIDIDDWNNPTFIATNGHRYYLSKSIYSSTHVSPEYGFRILAVDLNGTRMPNYVRKDGKGTLPPDIVQFLIMDNGDVYPIGPAADNLVLTDKKKKEITVRYMSSSIKGYCRRGSNRSDCAGVISSSAVVPERCKVSKNNTDQSKCGFVDTGNVNMTYRQGYCASLGVSANTGNLSYPSYCNRVNLACSEDSSPWYCGFMIKCPPTGYSNGYDSCTLENIKPIFRFNLN